LCVGRVCGPLVTLLGRRGFRGFRGGGFARHPAQPPASPRRPEPGRLESAYHGHDAVKTPSLLQYSEALGRGARASRGALADGGVNGLPNRVPQVTPAGKSRRRNRPLETRGRCAREHISTGCEAQVPPSPGAVREGPASLVESQTYFFCRRTSLLRLRSEPLARSRIPVGEMVSGRGQGQRKTIEYRVGGHRPPVK